MPCCVGTPLRRRACRPATTVSSLNAIRERVAGPYATLIASRNTVTRNLVGMSADFVGQLLTRGDNIVEKSGTDLNGTMTSIGGRQARRAGTRQSVLPDEGRAACASLSRRRRGPPRGRLNTRR